MNNSIPERDGTPDNDRLDDNTLERCREAAHDVGSFRQATALRGVVYAKSGDGNFAFDGVTLSVPQGATEQAIRDALQYVVSCSLQLWPERSQVDAQEVAKRLAHVRGILDDGATPLDPGQRQYAETHADNLAWAEELNAYGDSLPMEGMRLVFTSRDDFRREMAELLGEV